MTLKMSLCIFDVPMGGNSIVQMVNYESNRENNET